MQNINEPIFGLPECQHSQIHEKVEASATKTPILNTKIFDLERRRLIDTN